MHGRMEQRHERVKHRHERVEQRQERMEQIHEHGYLVCPNTKLPLACDWLPHKKSIHKNKDLLHHSILTEVILALQKEKELQPHGLQQTTLNEP